MIKHLDSHQVQLLVLEGANKSGRAQPRAPTGAPAPFGGALCAGLITARNLHPQWQT